MPLCGSGVCLGFCRIVIVACLFCWAEAIMASTYPASVTASEVMIATSKSADLGVVLLCWSCCLDAHGVCYFLFIYLFFCSVFFFQVGSYFVSQFYHVLRQQPDFVHQFYTDSSTMIRIDGDSKESASAMLVFLLSRCRLYVLRFFLLIFYLVCWDIDIEIEEMSGIGCVL